MDAGTIAQNELLPGERLVWSGKPDPAALARTRWRIAAPGLFMTLFALFWLATTPTMIPFAKAAEEGAPMIIVAIFPLVGLVMLGIGLYFLSAPLRSWRKAKRMAYAVTDGRVLIIEPGRVQSFEPGDIQHLERRDRGGGRGDLIFREEQGNMLLAMYTFGMSGDQKIGFRGVTDVRAAEEAVRSLKRSVA